MELLDIVCIKNGILTNKIIDRCFLGKAILEPLDKINMNDKHSTNMLYCKGCIDYVTTTVKQTFVV